MADNKPNEEVKPTEVVSPQAPAPEAGKAVVVDHSAPADNNIAEIKNGERTEDESVADQQPGDPKVKTTSEDGTVVERDATEDDLAGVETPAENKNEDEIVPANGDDDGQVTADDAAPTVKLKNPSGKVVEVIESDVVKRHMFAAGFTLVDGESYNDEIKNEREAYEARLKAANGISDGVDRSDPQQATSQGDIARRQGTKAPVEASSDEEAKKPAPAAKSAPRARNSRTAKALGK